MAHQSPPPNPTLIGSTQDDIIAHGLGVVRFAVALQASHKLQTFLASQQIAATTGSTDFPTADTRPFDTSRRQFCWILGVLVNRCQHGKDRGRLAQ